MYLDFPGKGHHARTTQRADKDDFGDEYEEDGPRRLVIALPRRHAVAVWLCWPFFVLLASSVAVVQPT